MILLTVETRGLEQSEFGSTLNYGTDDYRKIRGLAKGKGKNDPKSTSTVSGPF